MPRNGNGEPCPQRSNPGEKNPASRLKAEDALAIRMATGACRCIAKLWGISAAHVCRIKNKQSWRHI
jgi:hypothetical protein